MKLDPLKIAVELIKTPSISGEEGEVAGLIKDYLSTAGVDKVFIDKYGSVVAVIERNGGKPIVYEGHMDHVPPGNLGEWSRNPYEPIVVDDKLIGRGAVDMKGAIASMIAAVPEMDRGKGPDIYLVFVPHEEICEGVVFGRTLEETVGREPGLVVLGEATNLNMYTGQRGRAVVRIDVYGRSAHAAMPWEGLNPLKPVSRIILRLDVIMDKLPGHPVLGKTSLSPTVISCEPGFPPMIPDHCALYIDARFPVNIDRTKLLNALGLVIEESRNEYLRAKHDILRDEITTWTGVSLEVEHYYPAWYIEPSRVNGLYGYLRSIFPDMKTGVWRFSTDGVYSAGVKGITTIGIGPGDERLAHKPDEYVPVKHLYRASKIYSTITRYYAGREDGDEDNSN